MLFPFASYDYLKDMRSIEWKRCHIRSKEDINPEFIRHTFRWLLVYLTKRSAEKYQEKLSIHKEEFTAKNNSQVYFCRTLAIVYAENYGLERFLQYKLQSAECREEFKQPLLQIYMLYGLWVLEKHLGTLFQSNYFTDPSQVELIRESILDYCLQLKDCALSLVDALAPPDWVLRSPIGHSNGKPMQNLYDAIVTPESQERVEWWDELNRTVDPGSKSHLIKSKL